MVYEMKTTRGAVVTIDPSMIIINDNDMFKANDIADIAGKQIHHWRDNSRTKELIKQYQQLNPSRGIPLLVKNGGTPGENGTWVHKDLGHSFMMWCFPAYELVVNKILNELFSKGEVFIKKPLSLKEQYLQLADMAEKLEEAEKEKYAADVQAAAYKIAMERIGEEMIKQEMVKEVTDHITVTDVHEDTGIFYNVEKLDVATLRHGFSTKMIINSKGEPEKAYHKKAWYFAHKVSF